MLGYIDHKRGHPLFHFHRYHSWFLVTSFLHIYVPAGCGKPRPVCRRRCSGISLLINSGDAPCNCNQIGIKGLIDLPLEIHQNKTARGCKKCNFCICLKGPLCTSQSHYSIIQIPLPSKSCHPKCYLNRASFIHFVFFILLTFRGISSIPNIFDTHWTWQVHQGHLVLFSL